MKMIFKYNEGSFDFLTTNDGELHGGGNPLKRIGKEISRSSSKVGAQAKRSFKDIGDEDWWDKAIDATLAVAKDPKSWIKGVSTFGVSFAKDINDTWDDMTELEKAENQAKYDEAMALAEETRLIAEQEADIKAQEEAVAERTATEDAVKEKRSKRLGAGRKGLLFGTETGTKSDTLG